LLERTPLNERAALGVKETATYLGVSELIVKRLRKEGELVPLKNPLLGDRILFSRAQIDAFVAASHDQARKVA
jgi:excisionase family DNA binding protein